MVAVVAAVGGEIEGDRQAHLPGRQIAPVEGVGILRGREAGILPDGPGPAGIHGRLGPAQEGEQAGQAVHALQPFQIFHCIERLDCDAFGRLPHQIVGRAAAHLLRGEGAPVVESRFSVLAHCRRPILRGGAAGRLCGQYSAAMSVRGEDILIAEAKGTGQGSARIAGAALAATPFSREAGDCHRRPPCYIKCYNVDPKRKRCYERPEFQDQAA